MPGTGGTEGYKHWCKRYELLREQGYLLPPYCRETKTEPVAKKSVTVVRPSHD